VNVSTFYPIQILETAPKGREPAFSVYIFRGTHQYRNPLYPTKLLRAGGERPSGKTSKSRNELASPHALVPGSQLS
jgi:hypothetical protein